MVEQLLGADDDWIEPLRRWLYPKIHPHLKKYGGYGIGHVSDVQYVCTIPEGEEHFEEIIDNHWERNPISSYKTHSDGRESSGSWRLRGKTDPYGLINDEKMQLHVTLFDSSSSSSSDETSDSVDEASDDASQRHTDVYCHQEYDWMVDPRKHLSETHMDSELGRRKCLQYIDLHTDLNWYNKNRPYLPISNP